MSMNIVLIEPEIPQNTGNIARTCALTGTVLHLVKPLGFSIEDKYLKRAGLDYWNLLNVHYYDNFQDFLKKNPGGNYYFSTTKTKRLYTEVEYKSGDYIIFGKETKGIKDEILKSWEENLITIPMRTDILRSLNLSNAVNIVLFEAYRQLDFPYFEGDE